MKTTPKRICYTQNRFCCRRSWHGLITWTICWGLITLTSPSQLTLNWKYYFLLEPKIEFHVTRYNLIFVSFMHLSDNLILDTRNLKLVWKPASFDKFYQLLAACYMIHISSYLFHAACYLHTVTYYNTCLYLLSNSFCVKLAIACQK